MKIIDFVVRWSNLICILITFLAYLAPYISPAEFWPISFFGLSFPFLLVFNIVFVLYWAMRKKLYALFSVGVIVMGWSHVLSIIGFHFNNEVSPDNLKVTTFNAHSLVPKGQKNIPNNKVYKEFFHFLTGENADIFCFQEAVPFYDFYRKIPAIKKHKRLKNFKIYGDEGSVKIYTNLPVLRHKSYFFNGKGINGFMWADIEWKGKVFRIFNVHLESNKISEITKPGKKKLVKDPGKVKQVLSRFKRGAQKRAEQALFLREIMDKSPHPIIVCGDLNDIPQSFTYNILAKDLEDTFKTKGHGLGFTYSGDIPALRIDYIFTDQQLEPADLTIGARNFSDHKPVSCLLNWK